MLLAGDVGNPMHNYADPADVNGDTNVTAVDALIVINHIATEGEMVSSINADGDRFLDVNADGKSSAVDALQVINRLVASGEQVDAASLSGFVFSDGNGNGIQDGSDGPLPDFELRLLDRSGNPIIEQGNPVTTLTNSSGVYEFANRDPGLYRVAAGLLTAQQEQTFPVFERFAKEQFIETFHADQSDPTNPTQSVDILSGSVAAADLNDDGFVDLVIGNEADDLASLAGSLKVFLNVGGGETPFAAEPSQSIALPEGFRVQSVHAQHLNGDDALDLLVSSLGVSGDGNDTNGVFGFINDGEGTFASPGISLLDCAIACDGVLDSITIGSGGSLEVVAVSQRSETISFANGGVEHVFAGADPIAVSSGHFDEDGIEDVVVAHFSDQLTLFSSGSVLPTIDGDRFTDVEVADVDGDENQDILVTDWGTDESFLHILFGNGQGEFTPSRISLGDGSLFPTGLAIESVSGSQGGPLDVVIANESGSFTYIENLDSSENFQVTPRQFVNRTPVEAVYVDVTGDFEPEAIIANKVFGVAIYENQNEDYRVNLDGTDLGDLDFGIFGFGVVSGTKFNDENGNGIADLGEPGLSGVTIYVDLNGNNEPDLDEPSDVSAADGTYSIVLPGPDTYTIREVVPIDFRQTAPVGGEHIVDFNGAPLLGSFDFGNQEFIDFGDAPVEYGTALPDAARHGFLDGLTIGQQIDREPAGLPSSFANGDDLDGIPDDEDGVSLIGSLVPGATAEFVVSVTNTTDSDAFLQAFVDFNGDFDFDDFGEQIATNATVASNEIVSLPFNVPANAAIGGTIARFRLSKTQDLGPRGAADTGEVEDHAVTIVPPLDFGDAPDSYGTTLASNGANHAISSDLFFGALVDAEADGVPTTDADGDDLNQLTDDEDGILFIDDLIPGSTASVQVTATNTTGSDAFVQGFVDFGRDGIFDSQDLYIANFVIPTGTVEEAFSPTFIVPSFLAPGSVVARFRLSSTTNLQAIGSANNGEVEDHIASVVVDQPFPQDDDFDSFVSNSVEIIDVLGNDSSTGPGPLTLTSVTAGATGSLQPLQDRLVIVNDQGKDQVQYTRPTDFIGREEFTYTVRSSTNTTASANVFVFSNINTSVGTTVFRDFVAGDVLNVTFTDANTNPPRSDVELSLIRFNALQTLLTTTTPEILPLPEQDPSENLGGEASFKFVITEDGTYAIDVVNNDSVVLNDVQLDIRLRRAALESTPAGTRQILFLDFDGHTFSDGFLDPNFGTVPPFNQFLISQGIGRLEDPMIDEFVAIVQQNFDFVTQQFVGAQPGTELGLTILNSRDHADPGLDPSLSPRVTRIAVGGDGATANGGFAFVANQGIDVGNLFTNDGGIVASDFLIGELLSNLGTPMNPSDDLDFVFDTGLFVGNLISTNAGNLFGLRLTDYDVNPLVIMDLAPPEPADDFFEVLIGNLGILISIEFGTDRFIPLPLPVPGVAADLPDLVTENDGDGIQDSIRTLAYALPFVSIANP